MPTSSFHKENHVAVRTGGAGIACLLFLVTLLSSCDTEGPGGKRTGLHRTTDTIVQLSMRFSPPPSWTRLDSMNFDSLIQQSGNNVGPVSFKVMSVFQSAQGSGCTVTQLRSAESSNGSFSDSALTSCFAATRERLSRLGPVTVRNYTVDRFAVCHARANSDAFVVFSLLFRNKDTFRAFQIDYLLPRAQADSSAINAVAASALSVRSLQ